MGEMNQGGHLDLDPKSRSGFKIHPKPDKKSGSGFKLHPNPNEKSGKVGIVLMFPDFILPIGGSRDCPQCSPILSQNFEDSDRDLIAICPKVGIGHPNLNLDPTRPDVCQDTLPFEISHP